MNTRILAAVAALAMATGSASALTGHFSLDTLPSPREPAASETITFNPAWGDGASAVVTLDGETIGTYSAAGETTLDTTGWSAGLHTLTHETEGEVLTAQYCVGARPGRIYRLTGAPFVGNRLVLRAKVYGDLSNASYAWKRDGVTVATTERLDIRALTVDDFGSYTLTVTTPYGTATSEPYVVEQKAGTVVSWGASGHGRTETPEGLTGVAQVASGMNFNLALSTNGTVTAWGYNGHGGCDVPEGLTGVSFLAAGGYESQGAGFAVRNDGTVAAWGRPMLVVSDGWWEYDYYDDEEGKYYSWDYELEEYVEGRYWYEYTYTYGWDTVSTMPADLSDVVQVAVGSEAAIALKADGTVVSWGDINDGGYIAPEDLGDVVQVAAGSAFLMALKADGTVVVWNDGDDWYGECDVPDGLDNVIAIAAGKENWERACFALKADGTIVKWGDEYNYFGMSRNVAADAVALDAGQEHLMALDAAGNVRVWSRWNDYNVKRVPAYAANAFAIAAGGYHCSAIVPDTDGDSICDAEELAYGRDPAEWEDYRRSTVCGTVSTETGAVARATVYLYDATGTVRKQARTDAEGAYTLDGVLPATYTLLVKADGCVDAWYDGVAAGTGSPTPLAVSGNATVVADFQLEPGQGIALASVDLPDGSVVYLDLWPATLEEDGTLDLGEVAAPHAGLLPHTVTAKLPGADAVIPSPVALNGAEGETVAVDLPLDAPTGFLRIESEPAGATVYVDYADAPLGVTPLDVGNLNAGSHTILLKKDGYLRPRPVVATVEDTFYTDVFVPLHTAAETNEMTVAVTSALPDLDIYLDYLPTGEVTPATVGGMDPASHAGYGWYSASHTILLKHPMARPFAPRTVPEPVYDPETDSWSYESELEAVGPQLYDDADGDGIRNDQAIAAGANPFYTLEEALDAEALVWTAGGDKRWRALKTGDVATGGFARSGAIGDGESTWIETTVKGAGTLSFRWKTSCENRLDMVTFALDGTVKNRQYGEKDWTTVTVAVTDVAEHVFRWTYAKSANGSAGEDCAWLDEVSWTPDAAANARTLAVESRYAVCAPAPGSAVFAWGDEVEAACPEAYSNGLVRATCTGWTGTGSVPASGTATNVAFTILEDSALAWTWSTEYRLDLGVVGDGTLSRESGWIAEGTMAIVTATPGLYQQFVRWEGDMADCRVNGATIRAPMTCGRSLRAVFEPGTRTLVVANAFGAASPTNGAHTVDMGAAVEAWCVGKVEPEAGTRLVCTGWTGTGSVPASGTATNVVFQLLDDSTLAWTWQTNYLVRVAVQGPGSVDFTEGWVENGSNLVVTAAPSAAYTGAIWSGDVEGATVDGLRITVPVDGPKEIAITFAAMSLGTALEQERRDWAVSGVSDWKPVMGGAHDGEDAAQSGAIENGIYGESILSATFEGAGELTFWWKLNAAGSACGVDCLVDGQDVDIWLMGDTAWTQESLELGEGTHTVEWIFWSDGMDAASAAWLDQVAWSGDASDATETQTTPVAVPYAWLDSYALAGSGDYEAAAMATAANGENAVWECYVAGLDPTAPDSRLIATIRMDGDTPVVGYLPPRPEHTPAEWYHVVGKTNLADKAWSEQTEGQRFFKVRIVVP